MNVSPDPNSFFMSNRTAPLRFWFLGDTSVGKSSLIYKFVLESLPRNIQPTIGLENSRKLYKQHEISLWDTAGIEKFRANMNIAKQIRLADVVFLCFDAKKVSTLENLTENYYKEVIANVPSYKAIILLGLKSDNGEINFYEEIRNFVVKENIFYAETSIFFDDNYIYKIFSLDLDDQKVYVNSDYKLCVENCNLFLRGGVNAIIDVAISLVANYESNTRGSDFNTTFYSAKTVTLQDCEVKYPDCKCAR